MNKKLIIIATVLLLSIPIFAQSAWQQVTVANVTFQYRVSANAQDLEAKLSAPTTGWVAVGLQPTNIMQNANYILGYVSAGVGHIRDDFGTSSQTHASDVSLGGTDNITLLEATETGGVTMLHFSIPLNSGDQYDRILTTGISYPIILAHGSNSADNYTGMHTDAGFGQITLQAPVANDDNLAISSNRILGNYPNPFNPSTSVKYTLTHSTPVTIQIYNNRGQLVHKSNPVDPSKGENVFVWNGKDNNGASITSGVYIMKLNTSEGTLTHKMTMTK
ncbi:MAG: hypothetical protein CVU48_06250 [Candidatus Cloacimonetes bacterium HGW-Cloacimonetes-1]|jgi:hypothetical protein|nr:MAG: hypothetical protein CVU48_06250 [Candidatus Cloacimonetes bacterium HGW-Cloacimonetes-1]